LLVNGHYPVFSVAEHGPTTCLVDRLRPLLHQYQATTYLCGHDHNLQVKTFKCFYLDTWMFFLLQHLTNDLNGVHMNYFVVGAANFIDNTQKHAKDVPTDSLKFFWAGSPVYGGFGLVELNSTNLSLSFIDHSEQTLYQATMSPRS